MRSDLPRYIVEEMKEAFDYIDKNHSGGIDIKEMKTAIIELGLDGRNAMIREIFQALDGDQSRTIEFKEFLDMMTATMILGNDLTRFKNYFKNKIVS